MKRILLLVSLYLFCFYANAQQPSIQWENTIQAAGSSDILTSIEQTSDGGYIIASHSNSSIGNDKTENNLGSWDFWVVKLDATGAIQWQNNIGGDDMDSHCYIHQTIDGGYILGGTSSSDISVDKTENSIGGGAGADYWVLKLNPNGTIRWQNTIGGDNADQLNSLEQNADGTYILGGTSYSDISGDKTENAVGANFQDYWVVKLDTNGTILWQNTIGGNDDDKLKSVIQTSDGGYIVGGTSYSNASGDKTENLTGNYNYWIVKLNALGVVQWDNTIGANGGDDLRNVFQTSDGGYLVSGSSFSNSFGDKADNSEGGFDYWVLKLNNLGVIQWQNTIGGASTEILMGAEQTNDGGYLLAGYSGSGINGDKTELTQGLYDYWAVKINSNGVIQWDETINANDQDELGGVGLTADGGFILGGYSKSIIGFDKTENSLFYDLWVVKMSMCNASVTVTPNGPLSFCIGGSVTLDAGAGYASYSWSNGGVTQSIVASTTNYYTVTVTDNSGCTAKDSVYVSVNPLPTVTLTVLNDTMCNNGGTQTLNGAPSGGNYSGNGVNGNVFNAAVAGVGNHNLVYTYTDANGCTNSDALVLVVLNCNGLENYDTGISPVVYPNPVSDILNISIDKATEPTAIVYDLLGNEVLVLQLYKGMNTINMSDMNAGIYLLKLNSKEGSSVTKLVKK